MGIYLNTGNTEFFKSKNSQIYVDKSLLIEYTNKVINTSQNCICVSRPRRFGKSTDATFQSKDDVFTLLVHLGYLGYDSENKEVYIPNREVIDAFVQSIRNSNWQQTTKALLNSKELLEATWNMRSDKVADYIEQAHYESSVIQYNDENALSYTLSLAYYTARDYYTVIREMPTGKGYADIVFIPKKDKPAMVIELKWNKDVTSAIAQIKEKKYMQSLENYLDNLLLVGISYDRETKKHICQIEKYETNGKRI